MVRERRNEEKEGTHVRVVGNVLAVSILLVVLGTEKREERECQRARNRRRVSEGEGNARTRLDSHQMTFLPDFLEPSGSILLRNPSNSSVSPFGDDLGEMGKSRTSKISESRWV